MSLRAQSKSTYIALAIAFIGLVASIVTALNYPAVESLGTKVRLPVFHGATTWANLVVFVALALAALAFLITNDERAYRKSEALRWVAIGMWIAGSILGFLSALNTWDFTGSQTPVLQLLMADPRLVIQVIVALVGLIVLILPMVFDSRKVLAAADLIFPLGTFAGLAWAMNAGRALHPDSPVMNSSEFKIKALFFMMFGFMLIFAFAASFAITKLRAAKK